MTRERAFGRLEPGKRFHRKPREVMCAAELIGHGANPASCSVGLEVGFCGGVKLTSQTPFNVGVKNSWLFTSYLPWRVTKHKGKPTVTFHYHYNFLNYGRDGMDFSLL
jgi:hypothetical protein